MLIEGAHEGGTAYEAVYSLNAMVEDVVVVTRNNARHPMISASGRFIPVDLVCFIFVHMLHVVVMSVAKLLLHCALVGKGKAGEIGLHSR